jgi:23S rRNA pseudouridine1911/1915/1917 synthase
VASEKFNNLALVKCTPSTGRRHQIRKHLLHHGTPILGDKLYHLPHLSHAGKGLYLHAWKIEFTHPNTAERISITSPIPNKFTRIFSPDQA